MVIICVTLMLGYEYTSFTSDPGNSPYEMVYHVEPPDLFNFDYKAGKTGINMTTEQYLEIMKKRKEVVDHLIIDRKTYEKNTQWIRGNEEIS